VMCGNDAALPLHVSPREASLHGVAFEQKPQLGQFLQILD
jgi:hypothetical protein